MDCTSYGVSGNGPETDPQTTENAWKAAAPRTALRFGVNGRYLGPDGAELRQADALTRVTARAAALNSGDALFTAICARHELTLFDAETGACLSCVADRGDLPPRLAYSNAYGDAYPAPCATHGPKALAHVSNGRCTTCTDRYGRKRKGRPGNPVRHAARAAGDTSYRATCAIHGETDFHTVRGKCLDCFNSLGYPRKVPRS